ncbi:hypothetical protein VIF_001742 [Vibrio cholerae TM 11079-80]|nr:hypothetical protein VIF_001742 [Vibrio cholerae TM 11079-80]
MEFTAYFEYRELTRLWTEVVWGLCHKSYGLD